MSTRLDRLFLLLDAGSTPAIRKSAADQLGQVQKLHPHELSNLLTRIHTYLSSVNWDTRIAAGQAVEAVANNVPEWKPTEFIKTEKDDTFQCDAIGLLSLTQFNISQVLQNGASLLGSEGVEYDPEDEAIDMDNKEKLVQQRKVLNRRLGLDVVPNLGVDTSDWFSEEDLHVQSHGGLQQYQSAVRDLLEEQVPSSCIDLSARELNRAKRKAKILSRQSSREPEKRNGDSSGEPVNKMRRTSSVVLEQDNKDKLVVDNILNNKMIEQMEWPFEVFYELLLNDLFHTSWERRHGAATGLREILKAHGQSLGFTVNASSSMMAIMNQKHLEDLALRLVCVLALDRFGDYVSDEVVAPVRETAAQTLGVALQLLLPGRVHQVVQVLLQLLKQPQWEVRHGGLLGIKYTLAIRRDLTEKLLPLVLPAVLLGLQDQADDVRAVAAAALLPVSESLPKFVPNEVSCIVHSMWQTLLDLDDLTASTNSIMTLLSMLLAHPLVQSDNSQSLTELVPRLWPFFSHSIASVRRAALQTLHTVVISRNSQQQQTQWLAPILCETMRHIYQRCLLETDKNILHVVYQTWSCVVQAVLPEVLVAVASPWLACWLCLLMQPAKLPFDKSLLILANYMHKEINPTKARLALESRQLEQKAPQEYIGGASTVGYAPAERDICVTRSRQMAARLLGLLCSHIGNPSINTPNELGETPVDAVSKLLQFHLGSKSALQRLAVAQMVTEWAIISKECCCPADLTAKIQACLMEPIYYDEIAVTFARMQVECQDFLSCLKEEGITPNNFTNNAVLTLEQAHQLCNDVYEEMKGKIKSRHLEMFEERRQQLCGTVATTSQEQQLLSLRVQCSLGSAVTALRQLPTKLNPVIRPLMDVLKKEENADLQVCAACSLTRLVKMCVERVPCPSPKVIKNLCNLLCSDPDFTPPVILEQKTKNHEILSRESGCDTYSGILTLSRLQKVPETGRGRKPSVPKKCHSTGVNISLESVTEEDDQAKKQLLIQRRGATYALTTLVKECGADLANKAPYLWELLIHTLPAHLPEKFNDMDSLCGKKDKAEEMVSSLQVMEVTGPMLHSDLHAKLLENLTVLCACLEYPYTTVRHMSARCLAMLGQTVTIVTMNHVLEHIIPLLGASHNDTSRQGAIEAVYNLVEALGVEIVPYIVLLVVPVLGCMSDQNYAVRLAATQCFATLIKLMPLEAGIPDPPEMKSSLVKQKERERQFLEQLLDGSKIESYHIPVQVNAELRKYQQDGVNWLSFLNKYKLHGILCDDMGLGKTLQSICILSGDHHYRAEEYKRTKATDCAPLQSIVICPPTLTGHWIYEIHKFVDCSILNPLHYTGTPGERIRLQKLVSNYNLIVASYDVVRNDIDFFGNIRWNYCILDEGHIIKNSKTKLSKAVKQLGCNHRLILSGTPIQNNVLELWSLFDFLIPGFLGTEKQFQARYGRPILQSRDAKSSSKEQELGALAMEALHRQVLPFLLRRMKEDVLKDLPPKIIQDYYCELSPLQVQLYEDFAKTQAMRNVDDTVHEENKKVDGRGTVHVFQALQYLRKVCNHPALVLTKQHPEYDRISKDLKTKGSSLKDPQHAPKLMALRQLLNDCGIGTAEAAETPVVNQHRVLLFCQLKSMLDIVEKDLFKSLMPNVTYLRLDGSVPAGDRYSIVHRFNNDPSIDVLLLTTHVGGLGLNLTGADTVVFVEHDWNPMKDLQAMDRAHRIGQKKVVNVYRLVTRATVEEKIMGLQKFKLNIANTVISQENASLASMGTNQLLDLFSLDEKGCKKSEKTSSKQHTRDNQDTIKTIVENIEELWDETQYNQEYNMEAFMESLRK